MIKGRAFSVAAIIAVSSFTLLTAGCETGAALSAAKQPTDSLIHITRVTYLAGDKGTSVKVYGTGRFEHTSYKLADPLRIAVEMPNVALDFEPKRVRLNNSAIAFLNVVRFKKVNSVRIELELLSDVSYNITQQKNFLEIMVANAPVSSSRKRSFTGEPAGKPFTNSSDKDADISRLRKDIARLEEENIAAREAQMQFEEKNRSLKENLEEAGLQLKEAGGKAKALEARIVFMEGKLSDIQEKLAAGQVLRAAPDILAAPPAAQARTTERTEEEIKKVMAGWLKAWNSKDMNAYSAYYSDNFETDTMDRKTWLRDKEIKFARRGPIEVTVNNMEVSPTLEGAVVIFEQRFESPSYRDIGQKIISLTKHSGSWKIVSESWKPL